MANRRAALKLERPELALKAGQAERLRFAQLNMRLASPFPASLELLFEPMLGTHSWFLQARAKKLALPAPFEKNFSFGCIPHPNRGIIVRTRSGINVKGITHVINLDPP